VRQIFPERKAEDWEIVDDITKPSTNMPLLKTLSELRKKVFEEGIDSSLRKDLWPILLKVYQLEDSEATLLQKKADFYKQFHDLKTQWQSKLNEKETIEELFKIEKDVVRTDRFFSFYGRQSANEGSLKSIIENNIQMTALRDILMNYNSRQGFVQGMADIASTFLIVTEGDCVLAYNCFVNFMKNFEANFYHDGEAINKQLHSLKRLIKVLDEDLHKLLETVNTPLLGCFRWLLVLFRREFKFGECLLIWDQILSGHYFDDWALFICMAMIEIQRELVVEIAAEGNTDEIFRLLSQVSMKLDVHIVLEKAKLLLYQFQRHCKSQGFPISPQTGISLEKLLNQIEQIF
jgi:TBC1 domain family member 15